MRKNYLVHFIVSGKGTFTINGNTYELEAGQAFLIPSDVLYFYKADSEEPWHYMWFEINGSGARTLLREIFPNDNDPIYTTESIVYIQEQFLKMLKAGENRQILLVMGCLYNLVGNMVLYNKEQHNIRPSGGKNYVDTAIKYIENNYFKKITISEICAAISIERSYLCLSLIHI